MQRELACQLDPERDGRSRQHDMDLYLARRMEEAVAEGRSLREIEPSSAYGAFSHGLVCAQGGDHEAKRSPRSAMPCSCRTRCRCIW